jgi:hypothetical protein
MPEHCLYIFGFNRWKGVEHFILVWEDLTCCISLNFIKLDLYFICIIRIIRYCKIHFMFACWSQYSGLLFSFCLSYFVWRFVYELFAAIITITHCQKYINAYNNSWMLFFLFFLCALPFYGKWTCLYLTTSTADVYNEKILIEIMSGRTDHIRRQTFAYVINISILCPRKHNLNGIV